MLILAYFLSIHIIWWCDKKNNDKKSPILRITCSKQNHQMQYDQTTSWKSFLNAAELKVVSHNFYLYAYRVLQINSLSISIIFSKKGHKHLEWFLISIIIVKKLNNSRIRFSHIYDKKCGHSQRVGSFIINYFPFNCYAINYFPINVGRNERQ